ncbi:hypothetical protein FFI94_009735 [Rhodococcus sp. KBS0724]|uniref:hypothetical protein n=1 Tax=Rhodococcus sp. KBS0724 TaxID=1179674 RepID=UPI00110DE5D8|nr:hypothetical protein [Rhodococcus sp. KBS0724]TSD46416.1 hypothetical protein FFI94_009735 [Rhodococcus sp. KBS0724]
MGTDSTKIVIDFIARELPQSAWPHWTDGWAQEAEAAILDATFSARAAYGTPTTGVRAVITRWRSHRTSDAPLDNLSALADFAERGDELAGILGNRQRVPGNYSTKAEAAALGAAALVALGCTGCADISDTDAHRAAIMSVPGFGARTFDMLLFLSGTLTSDSIELLTRFATEAVGSTELLGTAEATSLLGAVAAELSVPATTLTHAAWRYQRTAEQPRRPAKSVPVPAM